MLRFARSGEKNCRYYLARDGSLSDLASPASTPRMSTSTTWRWHLFDQRQGQEHQALSSSSIIKSYFSYSRPAQLGLAKSWTSSTSTHLQGFPTQDTLCAEEAHPLPMLSTSAIRASSHGASDWRDFNTTITYFDVNFDHDLDSNLAAYIFFSNLLPKGWMYFW